MNPIPLNLPANTVVSNYLYPDMGPADYTQDLIAVALPNGNIVDLGWYPEGDPQGAFVIRVFYQHWDRQRIPPIRTPNLNEAIQLVENLARLYSEPAALSSNMAVTAVEQAFVGT